MLKIKFLIFYTSDIEKDNSIILFETNKKKIYDNLRFLDIQNQIVISIKKSYFVKHGSRIINLNKAKDNEKEFSSKLKILFNHMRQVSIANELIEISTDFSKYIIIQKKNESKNDGI